MSSKEHVGGFSDGNKPVRADRPELIGCSKVVNKTYSDSFNFNDVPAGFEIPPTPDNNIPGFEPSDKPISFLRLLQTVIDQASAAHIGLNQFIRRSLQPVPSHFVHNAPRGVDMWPCPMPLWSWTGSIHRGGASAGCF